MSVATFLLPKPKEGAGLQMDGPWLCPQMESGHFLESVQHSFQTVKMTGSERWKFTGCLRYVQEMDLANKTQSCLHS